MAGTWDNSAMNASGAGTDAWGNPLYGGGNPTVSSGVDQWGRPTYSQAQSSGYYNAQGQKSPGTFKTQAEGDQYTWYSQPPEQKNAMLGNAREDSIANFVARMQRPQDSAMNQQFAGDVGKYGGVLDAQLAAPQPVANNFNRFEAGLTDAESRLRNLLDNPDSINQSAAYKFRVGQGQEALQRSMGAKGMLNSGNRLQELTRYGQDMGSQEYDNQFNRINGLNNTYAQSWLGDKGANTARFAAEAAANNARTGTLADLYKGAGTAYNQNTKVTGDDRSEWGKVWNGQAPKNTQQYSLREWI